MEYTLNNRESIPVHQGNLPQQLQIPQVIMWGARCYMYSSTVNNRAIYIETTVVFAA